MLRSSSYRGPGRGGGGGGNDVAARVVRQTHR